MNKILNLFLLMSVMLSACKPKQANEEDKKIPTSTYTIYNKTFSINRIIVKDKFINTYSDSIVINGKTGVGNITMAFYKLPTTNKTYLIDTMPPITNPSYMAIRFDFMVNNQPPTITLMSTPKNGETVAASSKDGKIVLSSKGVTMTGGHLISFNIALK